MSTQSADYALGDAPVGKSSPVVPTLIAGGLVALAGLWLWISRTLLPGELISPVNPNLVTAAIFVGVFCGLLLAARIMLRASSESNRPSSKLDGLVGALTLPTLAATACLRMVVQGAAFIGATHQVTPAQFTISGFRTSHGTHLLRVRLGEGGREFSVPVRTGLYDEAHQGDLITLPVETGRFGIQRAMVAADPADTDLHPHA